MSTNTTNPPRRELRPEFDRELREAIGLVVVVKCHQWMTSESEGFVNHAGKDLYQFKETIVHYRLFN